jgi:hypothetical protein
MVFMDDILVFNKSLEEHIEHLQLVFEVLRKHPYLSNSRSVHLPNKRYTTLVTLSLLMVYPLLILKPLQCWIGLCHIISLSLEDSLD